MGAVECLSLGELREAKDRRRPMEHHAAVKAAPCPQSDLAVSQNHSAG